MNIVANFEHRAGSSQDKHEGESSFALCDRLGRTRGNSQRQLPTDHDYAVPTREYQTDQSSLKTAPAAARSVLEKTQRQLQKHPHRFRRVDTVTPYQRNALIALDGGNFRVARHPTTIRKLATSGSNPGIKRSSPATNPLSNSLTFPLPP